MALYIVVDFLTFTAVMENVYGESAALITAFCWTLTASFFESAGKKVGSLSVNIIRLWFAVIIYFVFLWIYRGSPFPDDAGQHQWIWLSLSGLAGFVIGDLFLFQSFVILGARISLLIMALVPPFTAILGRLFLNEILDVKSIIAMTMTLSGIALVILNKKRGEKIKSRVPLYGFLIALIGALGQAGGLVLSKYGMNGYDAFASSQIRIFTGAVGFLILISIVRKWKNVIATFGNSSAIKDISLGTIFGPFLGVSFSLIALKYTEAGIAATIMAITPVLIIPLVIFKNKEKVNIKEIIGSVIAVIGVALLFMDL
ncbi:MAG: DMT family transporter [Bacteroidota bacterium]